MEKIDLATLKDAASRLLFEVRDEENEILLAEFGFLSKQMEAIGQIEGLDEYEPMTFPFDCTTDFLREDEPAVPLSQEDALSNAGSCFENQIKLPKVVG